MRILGAELRRSDADGGEHVVAVLDERGHAQQIVYAANLPGVAAEVGRMVGDEPFLLAVDVPVMVPQKATRSRPVENLVRRRFGVRLPPGGRATLSQQAGGLAGEALMAGLAATGIPCLPYPDRDRRKSGLAEVHPELVLKSLLWERSGLGGALGREAAEQLFLAHRAPAYRRRTLPARTTWAEQVVALDRLILVLASIPGYDLSPARAELERAASEAQAERAAATFDAMILAATARRFLDAPESSLFLGDHDGGYMVLPADPMLRRMALSDARPRPGDLFPQTSLRERLGADARVREMDLLPVPGKPQRLEATFENRPSYEFDNRDEMLWWKHCRHLAGPNLPTEGLSELVVDLDGDRERSSVLRLVRSRHPTLSFRFDPPQAWRRFVAPRDNQVYTFRVVRAIFETR